MPLPRLTEDDAMLLEELMNGPPKDFPSSDLPTSNINTGGFAAQWDKMMSSDAGQASSSSVFGQDFGQFVGASNQPGEGSGLLAPEGSAQKEAGKERWMSPGVFLPSQLFYRDQRFHPSSSKGK